MAGDPLACAALAAGLDVSIRARHRWRAIPAPAGRRQRCRQRFNPRPPSMAGDPRGYFPGHGDLPVSIRARHRWRAILLVTGQAVHAGAVSIRARHRWRAIHGSAPVLMSLMAVSIRARHRWRAILEQVGHAGEDGAVSIRARHRWRAIPPPAHTSRRGWRGFNPRPPSMAGDPCLVMMLLIGTLMFQSAPAIDGGRSERERAAADGTDAFQSAPAIDGGRSGGAPTSTVRTTCFNPRPPSMAGDPTFRLPLLSPPLFQSAPAIDGGRSRCSAARTRRPACFNPRPPSMAGDPALQRGHQRRREVVSIRARHRWRAIPAC